jgi:two-component system CheB/CheR fusion protein
MMRMMPYRTSENLIAGLVLTFSDIMQQKQAEQLSEQARRYAEAIVETVREPLVILDGDLRVVSANPAFYRTFQLAPPAVVTQHIYDLAQGQWNSPRLRQLLEEIMLQHSTFEDFAVDFQVVGSEPKRLLLNARRIERAPELPPLILLALEEATAHPRPPEHQTPF